MTGDREARGGETERRWEEKGGARGRVRGLDSLSSPCDLMLSSSRVGGWVSGTHRGVAVKGYSTAHEG